MNKGGFSWKRFTGISAAKSHISRTIGVPLTRSGRQQKIGRMVTGQSGGLLILFMLPFIIISRVLGWFIGGRRSKSGSLGGLLLILVLLIVAGVSVNKLNPAEQVPPPNSKPLISNAATNNPSRLADVAYVDPLKTTDPPVETVISTEPESATKHSRPEILASLEGIALPAVIVTTEEVTLRNSTGKEVALPKETNIKVTSRSTLGTLSMEIKGNLFVGNESRISGKVKNTR